MNKAKKIILTKPTAQAQPLGAKLTASGYSVSVFPLIEIEALPAKSELQLKLQSTIANLSNYALAVFVSPNAIHAVFQSNGSLVWPSDVAIGVMGEGSRAALAQYGVTEQNAAIYYPADTLYSDSEGLLQQLDLSALKNCNVVIFRAETGREFFAEALTEQGAKVEKVVAYHRYAPKVTEQNSQQLSELMELDSYWVISSSEAVKTLLEMARVAMGEAGVVRAQQTNLLVSHQRIANTAKFCGFKYVRLVGSGDENLLLALQSQL